MKAGRTVLAGVAAAVIVGGLAGATAAQQRTITQLRDDVETQEEVGAGDDGLAAIATDVAELRRDLGQLTDGTGEDEVERRLTALENAPAPPDLDARLDGLEGDIDAARAAMEQVGSAVEQLRLSAPDVGTVADCLAWVLQELENMANGYDSPYFAPNSCRQIGR